jgi:hypothetical protein
MSQQGLCGLTNPFVTCESSFGGYFWVGSNLVFLDSFYVNRGSVRWWIHASALKTFSVMISERATTQFSLTVFESTGAVCADESMRHLWKQFRGLLLSGQRLSFPWLFMRQQGVGWRIHSSPFKAVLGAIFEWAATQFSLTLSESTAAVWADESMRHL